MKTHTHPHTHTHTHTRLEIHTIWLSRVVSLKSADQTRDQTTKPPSPLIRTLYCMRVYSTQRLPDQTSEDRNTCHVNCVNVCHDTRYNTAVTPANTAGCQFMLHQPIQQDANSYIREDTNIPY